MINSDVIIQLHSLKGITFVDHLANNVFMVVTIGQVVIQGFVSVVW